MRRKESAFIAMQAVIFALVLVLVSLPLEGAGRQQVTSSSSSSTSTTSQAADTVGSSFANHLDLINSGNASAILTGYEGNASVIWEGYTQGLGGTYVGAENVSLLLQAFDDSFAPFNLTNETYRMTSMNGSAATVNSTLYFAGDSDVLGVFNSTISAQDSYAYSATGHVWLISSETWNFLGFNVQALVSEETCNGSLCPSPTQSAQTMSLSEDGSYLAVGTRDGNQENGSVILASLQNPGQRELWRYVTNNSAIGSVAISANGSYVVAGGYSSGPVYGEGKIFFFNQEGRLLWNVSTGSVSPVFNVAISSNGSIIAADYENGILYLNNAGGILWNYTFPGQSASNFAMSSDGRFIVCAAEVAKGWGIFYLGSHGQQLWNYTEGSQVSFVQMSSDGSYVAAGSLNTHGNDVYFFDGRNGSLLWERPTYFGVQALVMSGDGSHMASTGNAGSVLFDSSGDLLWNYTDPSVLPAAISQSSSLVLLYGEYNNQVQMVRYNGTLVRTLDLPNLSVVAASPGAADWVTVGGLMTPSGSCATVYPFDGTTALTAFMLC